MKKSILACLAALILLCACLARGRRAWDTRRRMDGPTEDRYSASFSTMSRTSRGSTALGPGSFVMNQVIV